VLVVLVPATPSSRARERSGESSLLSNVRVDNGGRPFAGDRRLFATVSPNGDRIRDAAIVRFHLGRSARVRLQAFRTTDRANLPRLVWQASRSLGAGSRTFTWRPRRTIAPRTYLIRLAATDTRGATEVVGRLRRNDAAASGPVVRVLGIDAGFTRASYRPNEVATLVLSSDAPLLELQFFQAGPETSPSSGHVPPRNGWVPLYTGYRADELHGIAVDDARRFDWSANRNRGGALRLRVPEGPSGLYFVRLRAEDGRTGFAPYVLLPRQLGQHRVAVVLPTNTWEAYNHRDVDGDGWGDTWYADNSIHRVDVTRPYLHRGVPTRFVGYQLGFLRWLYQTHKQVDFLSDRELEAMSGAALFRLYDLLVFLGHHEYMTTGAYDTTRHYRDLGGNLIFTSTTNFLWRVDRRGRWIYRIQQWRDLGVPEAALVGVQYLSNDYGRHQGRYVVVGARRAPWVFRGTRLRNGTGFGHGGIEIDARTAASPAGTIVLARMPNVHGPGLSAEMTYYRTPAGAKVFASGTLNFAGTALEPRVAAVLENLWRVLSRP
jgi:N,N-dimethylformamidase beta subunit-like, C-terminal